MRGKPELQGGLVMLLVGAIGLSMLMVWGSSASPTGSGIVFTSHGYASAVTAIVLIGVLAIGSMLFLLGVILWLSERIRDPRTKS